MCSRGQESPLPAGISSQTPLDPKGGEEAPEFPAEIKESPPKLPKSCSYPGQRVEVNSRIMESQVARTTRRDSLQEHGVTGQGEMVLN